MNNIIERLAARQREKIKEVEMLNQKMMMAASGIGNVAQVAIEDSFAFAIKTDGTLWSWGNNNRYKTAQGTDVGDTQTPTKVGSDTDWSQVATSINFAFAIKTDGTLWSWGNNARYKTAQGTDVGDTQTPTKVGSDTDWAKVALGAAHGFAIKTDGTLWSWGWNDQYRTGQGTNSGDTQTPTQVGSDTNWEQVSTSGSPSFAIKTDGTMYSWGSNDFYATAQGTDAGDTQTPTQIGSDTDWKQVSAASVVVGLAVKTNGTLWAWGPNTLFLTAQGTTAGETQNPTQIGSDTDWDKILIGDRFMLAIKTDGTLHSWGDNNSFGTAQGIDVGETQTPTQVGSDTDWSQTNTLSVGAGSGYWGAAIKIDSTVYSWGSNDNYQTAQGTNVGDTQTPTQIDPF